MPIKFINNILHKVGYDYQRYNPRNSTEFQLLRILEQNGVELVIDVGANIGQYAISLLEFNYEGNIISFEPLTDAHKKLLQNSKNNPKWEVAPRMAIGNTDGETELNVSSNSYSSSILKIEELHVKTAPKSRYINTEKVRISKLDSLVGNILPRDLTKSYLKIDVQGYEKNVLDGAESLLKHVKGVQIELSLVPLYKGQSLYDQIISLLKSKGFILYAVFPGFTDNKTGQLMQMDGVFIRKH